jgi:hypothetical protein
MWAELQAAVLVSRTDLWRENEWLMAEVVIVRGTFATGITSITPVGGTWTNLCPLLA